MKVSAQVYMRLIFVWGKSMALARIDLRAFKRVRERVDQSAYRHHQSDWSAASPCGRDYNDRHFGARYAVQFADQGTAKSVLNNAVIPQFLEQGFHGGLYHHDRWDGKYHAP